MDLVAGGAIAVLPYFGVSYRRERCEGKIHNKNFAMDHGNMYWFERAYVHILSIFGLCRTAGSGPGRWIARRGILFQLLHHLLFHKSALQAVQGDVLYDPCPASHRYTG